MALLSILFAKKYRKRRHKQRKKALASRADVHLGKMAKLTLKSHKRGKNTKACVKCATGDPSLAVREGYFLAFFQRFREVVT